MKEEKKKTKKEVKVTKEKKEPKKAKEAKKETKVVAKKKTTKTETIKEPKPVLKKKVTAKAVLLDKKEQKTLKTLSKVISVVAKILRICAMIIVPFIFIIMFLMPILFSKIEINGNIIKVNDARIVMKDDYVSANIGNKTYLIADGVENIDEIITFLNDNSLGKIITILDLTLLFYAVVIIINIYILINVEKLFNNFHSDKTPFTKQNSEYIRMIGRLMIVFIITTFVLQLITVLITKNTISFKFNSYGILEILSVYVLYYIFTYAFKLQEKADTTIYD